MRYLERHQPVLYGLLRLVGVVEDDRAGARGRGRPPRLRAPAHRLGPSGGARRRPRGAPPGALPLGRRPAVRPRPPARRAGALRGERRRPLRAARAAPDARRRVLRLEPDRRRTCARRRCRSSAGEVDGAYSEQGVLVAPVPQTPRGEVDGLYVTNLSWGRASAAPVSLAPEWTLVVTGSLDATGAVGAHLRPAARSSWSPYPPRAAPSWRSRGARGGAPWRLLGTATGPRVELGGLRARARLRRDARARRDASRSARCRPATAAGSRSRSTRRRATGSCSA